MRRTCLALVLALGACASATEPAAPATALALARATWYEASIASYRFTLVRLCECTPEMSGPVVIEVHGGQIAERRYISGTPVDPQFSEIFTDVPGLFDLIEQAIALPAAALAVRYNPAYGYPESIQIDWVAGAVDDEVSYRVSEFTILDGP